MSVVYEQTIGSKLNYRITDKKNGNKHIRESLKNTIKLLLIESNWGIQLNDFRQLSKNSYKICDSYVKRL